MKFDKSDVARSLASNEAIELRRAMLHEPHIAPLTEFVSMLRAAARQKCEFPDFDPLDGGANAEILFLFEKPGPMTSKGRKGSGFISRDNNDATAAATFCFLKQANLPREHTVIWNIVPGWNGTRKVTVEELGAGCEAIKGLLPRLSNFIPRSLKNCARGRSCEAPTNPWAITPNFCFRAPSAGRSKAIHRPAMTPRINKASGIKSRAGASPRTTARAN